MFGTKREELILDWRTLHGGGFMIFVFARYCYDDHMKNDDGVRWA